MTVYDRFASTEDGQRRLAGARLRYRVLGALNSCLEQSRLTKTELAERLSVRKSAVGHVLNGDGNLRVNTIADYFAAMGCEVELHVVPLGIPRQKATGAVPKLDLVWSDAQRMEPIVEGGKVRSDAVRPWASDQQIASYA